MSSALLPSRLASMQVAAMWRAQEGALVLLGRSSTGVPRTGTVKLAAEPGARGLLRATAWPLAEGPGEAFIAAIRLPDHADPADGATLILRGARAADRDIQLPCLPPRAKPSSAAPSPNSPPPTPRPWHTSCSKSCSRRPAPTCAGPARC